MKLKTNDFDPLGGSGAPGKAQASELQVAEDMEKLQAAKLEKLHSELEATKAKLEDAESETARLELVAMEGAEALARERENSTRIKRESDAVREENQKILDRIGFERDLERRAQAEVARLRNLIREFFAQDESFEVREALRKAVE